MSRLNPAEIFRVLSVESRIRILEILKSQGPLGTNQIAEILGITPAAVSQHLKVMRVVGLVNSEREGYWIPHSIDEQAMEGCRQLLNHICECHMNGGAKPHEHQQRESIDVLRSYKTRLEDELKAVEEKIKELRED